MKHNRLETDENIKNMISIKNKLYTDYLRELKMEPNPCPLCNRDAHPHLSNGIAIQVPHMKEGEITEYKFYHANCIQNAGAARLFDKY